MALRARVLVFALLAIVFAAQHGTVASISDIPRGLHAGITKSRSGPTSLTTDTLIVTMYQDLNADQAEYEWPNDPKVGDRILTTSPLFASQDSTQKSWGTLNFVGTYQWNDVIMAVISVNLGPKNGIITFQGSADWGTPDKAVSFAATGGTGLYMGYQGWVTLYPVVAGESVGNSMQLKVVLNLVKLIP